MSSFNFLSPPSGRWTEYYELAILEADRSRLAGRIAAARSAIMDRAAELFTTPSEEESRMLRNALRTLNLLEGSAHRRDEVA